MVGCPEASRLQSLFSTSFIGRITTETGRRQERTLNIADQPWKHLLVFLLFTALGAACYRLRCMAILYTFAGSDPGASCVISLPGMALSLGAVYYMTKYIDTRKYRYIVPASVCMGAATVIKMNCLIYMVAIACFLLYDALDIVIHKLPQAQAH